MSDNEAVQPVFETESLKRTDIVVGVDKANGMSKSICSFCGHEIRNDLEAMSHHCAWPYSKNNPDRCNCAACLEGECQTR